MNPKVFVCHATEDKDRFVRSFGVRLRENGVDAWVDEWEIGPGDRLVRKIFDEGIKNAKSFIIVLSQISVEKPWVKDELDAAVVKRIEEGTKIIPVVLDDCEVPEVLRATRWVRIKDINNYGAELRDIINSIFDYSDKPPLGKPPAYLQVEKVRLPGLSKRDSMLLELIGESAVENDTLIITDEFAPHAEAQGMSYEEYRESLEILDTYGYIELHRVLGPDIPDFSLTYYGFQNYVEAFVPDYESIVKETIAQVVNHNQNSEEPIALSINQPINLVRHVLVSLEMSGHIKIVDEGGTGIYIYDVRPTLKRLLESF